MKTRVMGLMMLVGYAANANAADAPAVTATKKTGGQQVLDNVYGDVETRMTSWRFNDRDGSTQTTRDLALRPKLGTKIMNERLDLNLTLPVVNRQSSRVTEQAQPEALADFTIHSSELVDVSLNTTNYMATPDKAYDGYLDFDVTLKHKFEPLSFGSVSVSLLLEAESNLATQKEDANVVRRERADGLSLTEADDTAQHEQKETAKSLFAYPKISLDPSAVPGLTLSLASIMGPTYTPKYEETVETNGDRSLKNVGYQVRIMSQNRYTVKYAINSDVYIYNQLRQNVGGYNQERIGNTGLTRTDIENRTGIVMNLF